MAFSPGLTYQAVSTQLEPAFPFTSSRTLKVRAVQSFTVLLTTQSFSKQKRALAQLRGKDPQYIPEAAAQTHSEHWRIEADGDDTAEDSHSFWISLG